MSRAATLLLGMTLLASRAAAQAPMASPPPRLPPLMYVRIAGPEGMQVTFFRNARGQSFEVPCTIGMRPGFAVPFAVSLPSHQGVILFPTLEVRASLMLDTKLRNADFPATISFSAQDFESIKGGALLTKLVVLERPETALPYPTKADQPIELHLAPNRSVWHEAENRGLTLAVLHMGQRQWTAPDLVAATIPGTLLLPGEKVLPPPRGQATIAWNCIPLVDPIHGPASPAEYFVARQGDDLGIRAGYNAEGQLQGLGPSDTVVEYADSKGKKRITPSNRLALCVPRYLLIKGETMLGSQIAHLGPGDTRSTKTQLTFHAHHNVSKHHQNLMLEAARGKQKASGTAGEIGTSVSGRVNGLRTVSTKLETVNVSGSQLAPEAGVPADRPLRLVKSADKCGGLPGEVVTLTIRFSNQGGQPITNIAVSENLTARLAYVPGTAAADRETNFTLQPNEVGSHILRWEFPQALLPGDSGTVEFKVQIR